VNKINSFSILTKAAVGGQSEGDPFDKLQLAVPGSKEQGVPSTAFGGSPPSFDMGGVIAVNKTNGLKRFLLSFIVQAAGSDNGSSSTFAVDPEMVVGPNA